MWEPKEGAAIIKNSFIATGPHQMTVIPGDIIHVIESTGAWHRGRNLFTRHTGIFPSVCCDFTETETITLDTILAQPNDLIFYEASVTLNAALSAFSSSKTSQEAIRLAESIFTVVAQLENCQTGVTVGVARASLAETIDKLRTVLGKHRIPRSFTNNHITLSTYGREGLVSDKPNELKKTEYVLIHVNCEVRTLKKPAVCRFSLYDPTSKRFLSTTLSLLTLDGSRFDLLFDQLELRHVQMMPGDDGKNASLWLCIYTFDVAPQKDGLGYDRKFLSCAAVPLPRMKSLDPAKYFGQSKTREVQSMTGPKSIALELHKSLCNREIPPDLAKKLVRAGPAFQVKFTPIFGVTEEIIQKLGDVLLIPPLQLPLQVDMGFKRNMLSVTVGNVIVDSHPKKLRIAARIVDTSKEVFTKGLENLTKIMCDSEVWFGPVVSGKRPFQNETFRIDLDVTGVDLSSLYLVIQIDKSGVTDKKLSPFAYSVIRLSSDVGSLTKDLEQTIPFYEFKPAGKSVTPKDFPVTKTSKKKAGTLDYHIDPASTVITQDEYLYRLIHMNECSSSITEALKNFMFCGISEWSKFAPDLILSLCKIIVKSEENRELAFSSLQAMFAEMLSKAGCDYSEIMHQFIEKEFEVAMETDSEIVTGLWSKILELIMKVLDGPIQDQEYRTCIKTLPYHLELIGRSHIRDPDPQKQTRIMDLFDKLSEIIGRIETDKVTNSFYLTNQRLLLEHFSTMADDLPMIFGIEGACDITCKFVKSIRTDNDQINRAKMQLLWEFVDKRSLWTKETQEIMRELYTEQINWAFTKIEQSACSSPRLSPREESSALNTGKGQLQMEDYIYRILMSLFSVSNDDYAISFVSQLLMEERDSKALTMLLLTIAFLYPERFPFEELLKIIERRNVSVYELLFVLIHVANARKDHIIERMKKGEGKALFSCALDLAQVCWSEMGEVVDRTLNEYVYSINNDMTILVSLFDALPLKEKVDYDIANQLLIVYTYCQVPVLSQLWYCILKSDIELNGSCNHGRRATLHGLWIAARHDNFEALNTFFNDHSTPLLEELSIKYSDAVHMIHIIQKVGLAKSGEDERAEALIYLLNMAKDCEDTGMQLKMLKLLVELNLARQNNIEAGFTYSEILKLIPCDNTRLPKKMMHFKAKRGRELHCEVLFEIIELFISSHYEEFALDFCDQIIETCIEKFGLIELMPRVLACKETIYRNVSSTTRSYSSFIRASFFGNGFSKCFRNRTFVYRRGDAVGVNAFKEELKQTFPGEIGIGSDTPTEEQLQNDGFRYIQLANVVPSTIQEAQDPFHQPEYKLQPRYVTDFEEYNRPTVFRADILSFSSGDQSPRGSLSAVGIGVTQQFITVKNTFPYFARRVEVDTSKTVQCSLNPLENATIVLVRKTRAILSDYLWVSHKLSQNQEQDTGTISRLALTIQGAVHAGTSGKTKGYMEAYLDPGYLRDNPDQEKNVDKFKEALQQHMISILKTTRVLKDVQSPDMEESDAETAKNLMLMIKQAKQFGVSTDTSGKI